MAAKDYIDPKGCWCDIAPEAHDYSRHRRNKHALRVYLSSGRGNLSNGSASNAETALRCRAPNFSDCAHQCFSFARNFYRSGQEYVE
jgi:hypothetical protein